MTKRPKVVTYPCKVCETPMTATGARGANIYHTLTKDGPVGVIYLCDECWGKIAYRDNATLRFAHHQALERATGYGAGARLDGTA